MITIKNKYLQGYKFIDLFAGLGGFRLALESLGAECVYSDEWNEPVCHVYYKNFGEIPAGDITKIDEKTMINLNYKVDELGQSPEKVAHDFLVEQKLIKE